MQDMPTSTIEELYQTHIKPRPLVDRMRLLSLLASDAANDMEHTTAAKMTITERLARANYRGGRLFTSAEEVDKYIRQERDSWDG